MVLVQTMTRVSLVHLQGEEEVVVGMKSLKISYCIFDTTTFYEKKISGKERRREAVLR